MMADEIVRDHGETSTEWYYKQFLRSRFPDDLFNLGKISLPLDVKKLIKYCKILYLTDPLLAPAVNAIVEYPITDLIYETDSQELKKAWREILEEKIGVHNILMKMATDWVVCGNSFMSFSSPKKRFLRCPVCKKTFAFSLVKNVTLLKKNFKGQCPNRKCRALTTFKTVEARTKLDWEDERIILWDPVNMHIDHNPITDRKIYSYTPPPDVKQQLLSRREFLEDTPLIFLQAVGSNQSIEFQKDYIKHLSTRFSSKGWGFPYILPTLPIIFYIRTLRRAQQEIAFNFIFPLRVLFPQSTQSIDPAQHLSLAKFKEKLEEEIKVWMKNPAHILKLPFPLGYESLGAEAKALNFSPEIELASKQAIGALGIPIDLLIGPMNWSGGSIALRKLQTHFHNIRLYHQQSLNFIVKKIATIAKIQPITVKLTELKLIDDLARKQFWMQLWQNKAISLDSFMDNIGLDMGEEQDKILEEMKKRITSDSELKKAAMKEQEELSRWMRKENVNVPMTEVIKTVQEQLKQMPWEERKKTIERMQLETPELHSALYPQSEQLPSRREPNQ